MIVTSCAMIPCCKCWWEGPLRAPPEAVLASQPTMSRLDNKASLRDPVRAFDALADNFIASYQDRPPQGLVLHLDPAA